MQVYCGLDIGTGKVTAEERGQVPHYGLDLVQPDEPFDAADFIELADTLIASHPRVVVAGGTSLYLRSIVRGLVPTPPVDPAVRARFEELADPHTALAEVDPALAERLHPNDRKRLVRGLEVHALTGTRLSELQAAHAAMPDRVHAEALWLDRDDLSERINARVHAMMADGYLSEVRRLLDAGFARTIKPMQSLGYRHLADHTLDGLPLDEAIRRTQRDTRRFARKQRNWMRRLGWPRILPDHGPAVQAAAELLWGT